MPDQGLRLNRAFVGIKNPALREAVVSLVIELAGTTAPPRAGFQSTTLQTAQTARIAPLATATGRVDFSEVGFDDRLSRDRLTQEVRFAIVISLA